MPKYCAVPGCGNASRTGSALSFFKFPKNPKLLAKWNNAIKPKGFRSTSKQIFVCSEHFTAADFQIRPSASVKLLKDDAVPNPFYNKCSFLGCTNVQEEGSPYQFFKFPSVIEPARQLWIAATGQKNFILNNSARICSAHFSPDQIVNKIVRYGVVPKVANPQFLSHVTQEVQVVSLESERTQITEKTAVDPAKKTVVDTRRKTALVSGSMSGDSANQVKESNSKSKLPIKGPVTRRVTEHGMSSDSEMEVQNPNKTLVVELLQSDLPRNDFEKQLVHYTFVREGMGIFCFKFTLDEGVEVNSTEEKEYDRMAQRIVDAIKDFHLLNKLNKSLKKLNVLMTCLPLIATNCTKMNTEKSSNERSTTDVHFESSCKVQHVEKKQKEKINSNKLNSKTNKNSCENVPQVVATEIETRVEVDPSVGAHMESNGEVGSIKNISVNFCHDHTYITTSKPKTTKTKTATAENHLSEICSELKNNKIPKNDNLFRTRVLKKIEDFKTIAKRKIEANRKLREKIRKLQYKLEIEKIAKLKVLKKGFKSANVNVGQRNPLSDYEFIDDYASLGCTFGAATRCLSRESDLEEDEDMEEPTDEEESPTCDIYICEPVI